MKVTLQESLTRAGLPPDQYTHLQGDERVADNNNDSSMMGGSTEYSIPDGNAYFNPYLANLIGFDTDQDLEEEAITALEEDFLRELSGLPIDTLPQDLPNNYFQQTEPNKQALASRTPVSVPASIGPLLATASQPAADLLPQRSKESPIFQVHLRKTQEGQTMPSASAIVSLPSSKVLPIPMVKPPPSTSVVPIYTEPLPSACRSSMVLSPAPSTGSDTLSGGETTTVSFVSDSPSAHLKYSSLPRSSPKPSKSTFEMTFSPDTSTVEDISTKPVRSKPVDIDVVSDRNKKNAIQARLNRQKKKAYVESLEESVDNLSKTNAILLQENKRLQSDNSILKEELAYVKNVLSNDSSLAQLMKNIGNSQLRLSSSFFSSKRTASEAGLEEKQPLKVGSGVCLHVDNNDVSVELCAKCSQMAQGASRFDVLSDKPSNS